MRNEIKIYDKIILILLVSIAIESVFYFGNWWFLGGHNKRPLLFAILSFAIFWPIVRGMYTWILYFFISIPNMNKKIKKQFTVDVLTTAMPGEPYEMFEKTLKAIVAMDYPHNTFLLDGGNDEKLKKLCKELGVIHIDSRNIPGAKAGKINNCLRNYSKADIVLILDPDHIPQKDFLLKVLPHFEDDNVGFVQVVQAYYNLNDSFVAYGAAEQTFGFYGPLQMSLHGLGIPTAIGANCTFKRKTLDDIGGHAEHLAEDALTSMRIHAKGYKSVYLPYRGSYGLVPSDLRSYFKQQLKWSNGMFQLFFRHYPKLFKSFNLAAKIHYFFAGTFYFQGLVTALTYILPIIFLFFQLYAVEMELTKFLIHITPYIISSTMITFYIQKWYTDKSEEGLPIKSMLLERANWYLYLKAFYYAIVNKKIPYTPTPKYKIKGKAIDLIIPHIIITILSLLAILYAIFCYYHIDNGTALMIFFASLNIILNIPIIYIALKGG